ncbi:MAG: HupE/UreJ family protein [Rhodospirillales bacterium]|nr:HupE/UreJ family protein [Rhodospirillales bacterium]MCW8861139.1 HupE/UreJ family protein [Rhodospirillales bacterium]MCW9001202.1 HupE/UreJ family protein [Rhodospirillales bacterium]
MNRAIFALAAALVLIADPAFAHTGAGHALGVLAGVGHPFGGLDHVLAMVAVGMLAAQMGGRAIWAVPLAFIAVMLMGGGLAVAGLAIPFIEQGIVGSVVVLGAVIAFGRRAPLGVAMGLVGFLAIFHGHAHGTEMPLAASGLHYALGFTLASAALHGIGLGIGLIVKAAADRFAPIGLQAGGATIAVAGAVLFVL